jgi:type I restriction enzyme M protein
MYASSAGKSGGEYYTPQEVSELLARITVVGKTEVNKVYDPACGSGSLLLKFAKVLGKDKVRQGFFGQEINLTTYNLCRINMFLHDINYEQFDIAHGDTPHRPGPLDDEPVRGDVSNPPYSINGRGPNPLQINDPRFAPARVLAPKSKADLAFTMHMLPAVQERTRQSSSSPVCCTGQFGQKIRKYLNRQQLRGCRYPTPTGPVSFGTGSRLIIVLKKSKRDNKVLFIDAPQVRPHRNKTAHSRQPGPDPRRVHCQRADADHFVRLVDNTDIADKGANIAVTSYSYRGQRHQVATDINALNAEIARIVARHSNPRTDRRHRRRPRKRRRMSRIDD